MMTSAAQLQSSYNSMYIELRKYIWTYETVQTLAELEVQVYSTFPDVVQLQSHFNKLFSDIQYVYVDDEELKEAVDNFKSMITKDARGGIYSLLNQVEEVNQSED